MHCPSCGLESSLDQKFCRKCGFNLEPVSRLVSGDAGDDEIARARAERERQLVRRMFRWISWGCLVLLLGVILVVINKGFIHEAMFQSIASLLILGGAAMAGYGTLSTMVKGTYLPAPIKHPEAIKPAIATNELPEAGVPTFIPSVTERTTKLIGEDSSRERE
ncbi:MAG TPA: zinc ribbon domain-containing protein [Pyrinomonadaceae bacterium]|nr:zinc ribbon domain-containing protein [Pyrinomonadaceae bacterium]